MDDVPHHSNGRMAASVGTSACIRPYQPQALSRFPLPPHLAYR
ncbi:hypothetical protein BACT_0559 [Bifidobacterium actinocoloniiforme DSM 22766]|uniref:Uncharacterized protein n=1 Tax=Bifidobacterium actinocoloniiforme DSM 22766 TaxID=1437605 RepID=A0A086Z008_9BIFI|nr:hypothetical protein BACT_0559 [Bifidobacterium actinocoloniiforme DSM 22766]